MSKKSINSKMKVHLLWLAILTAGRVVSLSLSTSLDIEKADKNTFDIKISEFDNIYYEKYTPSKEYFVSAVKDGDENIWESDGIGMCVSSLLSKFDEEPHLLYLKIDCGYSYKDEYYLKEKNKWSKISYFQYSEALINIRRSIKHMRSYLLVLPLTEYVEHYSVEYASESTPYAFFTSNIGYFATSVSYDDNILWRAEKYGDRCAAAWAYMRCSLYYMIRLLITRYNEQSEIQTFFLIDDKWTLVHTLKENMVTNSNFHIPKELDYPQYAFDLRNSNYLNLGRKQSPINITFEGIVDEFKSLKFDLSEKKYPLQKAETRFERLPSQIDYKPAPVEISPKDCLKLDVSESSESVKYKVETVFDKKLTVVSYYPPPGKYFDRIKEGQNTIYSGSTKTNLCKGFNFYLRNKELYLADLIIKVNSRDSIFHYIKRGGSWLFVSSLPYYEALKDLRSQDPGQT